jgi:hypothetical protein
MLWYIAVSSFQIDLAAIRQVVGGGYVNGGKASERKKAAYSFNEKEQAASR